MHAYAHAMQCNYGAKHLRCYSSYRIFIGYSPPSSHLGPYSGTPGVRFEYRKGPESIFVDQTLPIVTDRTRHRVRSTPHILLSLWVPDQTCRSRE
jgi:hypothetical protein